MQSFPPQPSGSLQSSCGTFSIKNAGFIQILRPNIEKSLGVKCEEKKNKNDHLMP